jgi:hypothetical protein
MAFTKAQAAAVAEVRPELDGFAKFLADRIWGAKGPAWGTTLTEIEDIVVAVRDALTKTMLHQALQGQADGAAERPAAFHDCPSCGRPTATQDSEPRYVQTRGGDAEWQEPHEHCSRCRRAFFPSVQEFGH